LQNLFAFDLHLHCNDLRYEPQVDLEPRSLAVYYSGFDVNNSQWNFMAGLMTCVQRLLPRAHAQVTFVLHVKITCGAQVTHQSVRRKQAGQAVRWSPLPRVISITTQYQMYRRRTEV